jgi:lysophospholipase L1-like esterase
MRYQLLAEECGFYFADSENWGIDIAYDGVHFTERGHVRFAEVLYEYLNNLNLI